MNIQFSNDAKPLWAFAFGGSAVHAWVSEDPKVVNGRHRPICGAKHRYANTKRAVFGDSRTCPKCKKLMDDA